MSELDLSIRVLDAWRADPAPRGTPARWAIAAAVLLHVAILAWLLLGERSVPAPPPAVVPVSLILEPPPPPTPAPKPAPVPPPPPEPSQVFAKRESGSGEKTTAPPQAEETAPEPEAPTPPPIETAAPETAAPAPKDTNSAPAEHAMAEAPAAAAGKEKPHRTVAHTEPRKEASLVRAPRPESHVSDRALGEHEETGDPYLNMLWARVERNRPETTPVGPSGLHLDGISIYDVLIDRSGVMRGIKLLQSSGSEQLDDEARQMIVSATPFPQLPPDYPSPAPIKITIHLYPQ